MPAALRPLDMTQIVTSPEPLAAYVFLPLRTKVAKAMNDKGFAKFMAVVGRAFEKLARKLL
jgi:hypothetical protein